MCIRDRFYDKLPKAIDTGLGKQAVQVIAFFAYNCKACEKHEDELQSWLNKNDKDISFIRVPSTLVRNGNELARLHYTAQELSSVSDLRKGLYDKVINRQIALDRRDLLAEYLGSRTGKNSFSVEMSMESMSINSAVMFAEELSTCLLYTSPSPRDATLSRMPSSA